MRVDDERVGILDAGIQGRTGWAARPAPPYAPSTWNHRPYSRQTSATEARSSTMPKFVVPQVATTAKKVAGSFSSGTARSAGPVSRPALVDRDRDDLAVHDVEGGLDGRVRAIGRRDPPRSRGAGGRVRPGRCVPGRDQRGEVADRPAGDEDATGRRRHPDEVGDPAQGLVLGVDRPGTFEPRPAIDRRQTDDGIESGRLDGGGARDERGVPRMVGGQAGRGEDVYRRPPAPRSTRDLRA